MKRLNLWLCLALLAGCAEGTGTLHQETVTTEAELVAGCEELLDHGAEPLALGSIEGTNRFVLDTDEGRCVEEAGDLLDTLRRHEQSTLVAELSESVQGLTSADPSPHPDRPDNFDPRRGVGADPSPHPDRPGDIDSEADDEEAVVIIWIVFVEDDDSESDMMTSAR